MASVTRGKNPHRTRRVSARARIVDAANELLEQGERFTEIPVERLLTESGVSRSTFYVHFADKSALLLAIAEEAVQEVMAAAVHGLGGMVRPTLDDVADEVLGLIALYRKHSPMLATIQEVGAYDDEVRDFWRRRREEFCALISDRFRDEQSRGLIPASVNVDIMSGLVTQLTDTAILEHIRFGAKNDDAIVATEIARVGWLARYGTVPNST